MATAHLAIDLGASSGRAIVGVLDGNPKVLKLEEVHRFEHHPCPTPSGPVWDLTGIWLNLLTGLKNASSWCDENEIQLTSVGVDTWGVDWCLVGSGGELLGLPHCYRDPQNDAACEQVLAAVGGKQELYRRTGIQLMAINSLFQVVARHTNEPGLFPPAHRLLFIPDLFHYWLSGELTTERTIASTSSMLSLESGEWDIELLEKLGIPTHMLGPIIDPGSVIGELREPVAQSAGLAAGVRVIAPAAHDTAAAVAAIPVADSDESWAFLSSGTWSLLGAELDRPFASDASCAAPFTNERGIDGTVRFLKNIGGLWLVQELRRELVESGEVVSFSELTDLARSATPFRTLINPNASRFGAPGDMANKIREFARETGQPVPESTGERVRCCLESLALCYRHTVDLLESVTGTAIDVLYVVGGGINNGLLNDLTVAAMERPVVFGPVEATATGNVLVQAMGAGELSGVKELRQVVANSFETRRVAPTEVDPVPKSVFALYEKLAVVAD